MAFLQGTRRVQASLRHGYAFITAPPWRTVTYKALAPRWSLHQGVAPLYSPSDIAAHRGVHEAHVDYVHRFGKLDEREDFQDAGFTQPPTGDLVKDIKHTTNIYRAKCSLNEIWSHSFLWRCLVPHGHVPTPALAASLEKSIGIQSLFEHFIHHARSMETKDGWVWLVALPFNMEWKPNKLLYFDTKDHSVHMVDSPVDKQGIVQVFPWKWLEHETTPWIDVHCPPLTFVAEDKMEMKEEAEVVEVEKDIQVLGPAEDLSNMTVVDDYDVLRRTVYLEKLAEIATLDMKPLTEMEQENTQEFHKTHAVHVDQNEQTFLRQSLQYEMKTGYPWQPLKEHWEALEQKKAKEGVASIQWDSMPGHEMISISSSAPFRGLLALPMEGHGIPFEVGCHPILALDMWSHAHEGYNQLDTYVEHWWRTIDWGFVETRLKM